MQTDVQCLLLPGGGGMRDGLKWGWRTCRDNKNVQDLDCGVGLKNNNICIYTVSVNNLYWIVPLNDEFVVHKLCYNKVGF